jgi:signal peptidase I
MSALRHLARGLQHVVLGLAVVVFVALAVGPRSGRYQTWTVLSGSMRPGLPPGAVAVVTPKPAGALAVGDVLIFHPPAGPDPVVAHRVIGIDDPGAHPVIRTKGDANPKADPWEAQLLGDAPVWTVRWVVPYAGFVLSFLRQDALRFGMLYLAPALLALFALAKIWNDGTVNVGAFRPTRYLRRDLPSWYLTALADAAVVEVRGGWRQASLVGSGPSTRRESGRSRRRARATATTSTTALLLIVLLALPAGAAFSDVAAADLPVSTGTLAVPSGVSATVGCQLLPEVHSITVSWNHASDTLTDEYEIYRTTGTNAFPTTPHVTVAESLTSPQSYKDDNLSTATTYKYYLRSKRDGWTSSPSATVSATTKLIGCL